MWGLFIVSQATYFTTGILIKQLNITDYAEAILFYRVEFFYNKANDVYATTLMCGHWVFCIKYAEVVLKLPLIVFPENVSDMQTKLKIIF